MLEVLIPALLSIALAVSVPLTIERIRRPILRVEFDEPPIVGDWSIAHVQVRNLALAERGHAARWLGRWLTAFAADGCSVRILIHRTTSSVDDAIGFDGKWTSRHEPISTEHVWDGTQLHRVQHYDPQKLPGIHRITLQPGDWDSVALAIRERGAHNAYAYWAERIYDGPRPFPEHKDCELPPDVYRVEVQARAGDLRTEWHSLELVVDKDTDLISIAEILSEDE